MDAIPKLQYNLYNEGDVCCLVGLQPSYNYVFFYTVKRTDVLV